MLASVIILDLSKAYDKVNWLYLRLLMVHMGFFPAFVNWVEDCYKSVSYAVLVNGPATSFFKPSRRLRQRCPLSPTLFLLVAEYLSRYIEHQHLEGLLKGIRFTRDTHVTHLLFVNDILLFGNGSIQGTNVIVKDLNIISKATGMEINSQKSTISRTGLSISQGNLLETLLPFKVS